MSEDDVIDAEVVGDVIDAEVVGEAPDEAPLFVDFVFTHRCGCALHGVAWIARVAVRAGVVERPAPLCVLAGKGPHALELAAVRNVEGRSLDTLAYCTQCEGTNLYGGGFEHADGCPAVTPQRPSLSGNLFGHLP